MQKMLTRAAMPFAIVILFAVAVPAVAAEVQLVPLQDYVSQPGVGKDPVAAGYVMERCSALYAVFAKNLEGETDLERQKVMNQFNNVGEQFMGVAVRLMMQGTTIEVNDALARIQKIVVDLGNLYTDRISAVRLRTNNMFSDALIAGDFVTCKGLIGASAK